MSEGQAMHSDAASTNEAAPNESLCVVSSWRSVPAPVCSVHCTAIPRVRRLVLPGQCVSQHAALSLLRLQFAPLCSVQLCAPCLCAAFVLVFRPHPSREAINTPSGQHAQMWGYRWMGMETRWMVLPFRKTRLSFAANDF